MANVILSRYEVENHRLPNACLRCGAPATVTRNKQFSWNPPWVFLLIFAGLLPLLIVALITTKKMRMSAPFCDEHKGHWSKRSAWTFAGFGLLTLMVIGAFAVGFFDSNNPVFGVACMGVLGAGVVWLIAAAVMQHTSIRPTKITDREITLTNVSPEFVQVVEAHHDEHPEIAAYPATGGSGFPIVAVVALGCVAVVIALAAISVLGEKSRQNQPTPPIGFNVNAPIVNAIPHIDEANHFRLNHPGPGWSIYTRPEAERLGARAGAHHTDDRTGLIRVKDLDGDEVVMIAGREEHIAKAIFNESSMKNKRLVRHQALQFEGQAALRVDYMGDSLEAPGLRVASMVFVYREKLYTVTVVGLAARTAEDGSSFSPFMNAIHLLGRDEKDLNKKGNPPRK
jgi:hypothetical protein